MIVQHTLYKIGIMVSPLYKYLCRDITCCNFSRTFSYKDGSKRRHTFLFPYISQLLNMLIENSSPFLETALKKAIAYNETTLEKLSLLIKQSINNGYYYSTSLKKEVDFFENGNIVSFRDPLAVTGIITNIVNVTKESKDAQVNKLIEKLNNSYNNIRNI